MILNTVISACQEGGFFTMRRFKISLPVLALFLTLFHAGCNSNNTSNTSDNNKVADDFYMPAEWEGTHESIWFGWPTYENVAGISSEELEANIIRELVPHVMIDMAAYNEDEIEYIKGYLETQGISASDINDRIRFHVIPHNDLWFRDILIFLKNRAEGATDKLAMIDFNFNTWGFGFLANADLAADGWEKVDEGVDRDIAAELGIPVIHSDMVVEGGALEVNGQGTMLAPINVFTQRNPNMTLAQMEDELKRVFNVTKVIWLPGYAGSDRNPVDGPYLYNNSPIYSSLAVGGHLDEIARFVSTNKVLVPVAPTEQEAMQNPLAAQSRETILAIRNILQNETIQDGTPIKIVDFVDTGMILQELNPGDGVYDYYTLMDMTLIGQQNIDPTQPITEFWAASYMNYLVTNNVVIAPKYENVDPSYADKDAQAKSILEQVFPGRTVVQHDPGAVNVGGGGIHCITQQMPATN